MATKNVFYVIRYHECGEQSLFLTTEEGAVALHGEKTLEFHDAERVLELADRLNSSRCEREEDPLLGWYIVDRVIGVTVEYERPIH